jgi:hypothetical protein
LSAPRQNGLARLRTFRHGRAARDWWREFSGHHDQDALAVFLSNDPGIPLREKLWRRQALGLGNDEAFGDAETAGNLELLGAQSGKKGSKQEHWFSVPSQIFAFAGIRRPTEKGKAYAFLTWGSRTRWSSRSIQTPCQ